MRLWDVPSGRFNMRVESLYRLLSLNIPLLTVLIIPVIRSVATRYTPLPDKWFNSL